VNGLAGAVVWAVVPFAPEAPFRLYAGVEHTPIRIDGPERLIRAAEKGGDPQLTFLVSGKVRPTLILSDEHDESLGEYIALRLARFSKLDPDEQQLVRNGQSPTHFYLERGNFPGLSEENAAMVGGLIRVHRSAVAATPLGRLDANALATLHERVVRFYGFDLRMLVTERLKDLAEQQRRRRAP
jgi:hypothetical protein